MPYRWHTGVSFGLTHCECLDCPIDTHGEGASARMLAHCTTAQHGREPRGMTVQSFIAERRLSLNVIITFNYLCWNTREASVEGAEALLEESTRLGALGSSSHLLVYDNGSTDNTIDAIKQRVELEWTTGEVAVRSSASNLGISRGRNALIEAALTFNPDYMLLMDGDIEVVPLSIYTMARYLECHPELGCIGAYPSSWTCDRALMSEALYEIPESRVHSDIICAFTQYGVFRASMFKEGIRFDESGPFGEPGWGFEDDDLAFQMMEKGYGNKYFSGMCYLHRNLRSSLVNLAADGIDIPRMFNKRKDYLVEKWTARGLNPAILSTIKAQQMPK